MSDSIASQEGKGASQEGQRLREEQGRSGMSACSAVNSTNIGKSDSLHQTGPVIPATTPSQLLRFQALGSTDVKSNGVHRLLHQCNQMLQQQQQRATMKSEFENWPAVSAAPAPRNSSFASLQSAPGQLANLGNVGGRAHMQGKVQLAWCVC